MTRYVWVATLALCSLAVRADVEEDLAKAARSPEPLVRFVETHDAFDWGPLWNALGIDEHLPECEDTGRGIAACSAEMVTVVEPFQVIVILKHEGSMFEVFLRYRKLGANSWKLAGSYSPFAKYFAPEHRIVRLGAKPFLAVTGQGYAGTGISTTIEHWIDLTLDNFNPVFEYTKKGDHYPAGRGIERTVQGDVLSFDEPPEQIKVSYSVDFFVFRDDKRFRVGGHSDTATYVRTSSNSFVLDLPHTTATAKDIETFYDLGSGYTDAKFLKFNLNGLKQIATGDDARARDWLWRFLSCCPNSPEANELRALSKTHPR